MKSYFEFQLSKGYWPICLSKRFPNETQASLCLLWAEFWLHFWRGWENKQCLCRNHEEFKIIFGLSSIESTWNFTIGIGKLRMHTSIYPNKCSGQLL